MTIHQQIAAGIDLGSNTFRLLVADCSTETFSVLAKELATVGLGRGLKASGRLQSDAMQTGFEVLRTFRQTLDRFQPGNICVCGTEALRQAENSRLFLQQAEEILQQPVHIINGEQESSLSLAGVLSGHGKRLFSTPLLLVDVGGGSTELVFAESPAGEIRTTSVGLGVIWLTEKFISEPQDNFNSLDSMVTEILETSLAELQLLKKNRPVPVLGCGGTATSMASLQQGLLSYDESLVHGYVLRNSAIEKIWARLIVLPAEKRNELPCLGEGRGEILPAGIRIFHLLLKLLQLDRMQVSDTGLLEGIMLSSVRSKGRSR